ncbi:hypothetical protein G6F58_013259 [Rhizopus delemar]|uniref:Uncharacterized protein n=1 Tax=Rhizopus delemar TaxID=936053 RepID=A0A9P6Y0W7_9FUNG|nr:hypothetical protein G6F24_017701 [Rhizopus arrhizus]KAG1379919.1 hypothetical protein G6F59_018014 [Rhizopus arrhizus]KAG1389544.1 hypothetical protein G6F58_013259 [Rhizopus delemar]KAG1536877.1 hypothetical protein G6F50_014966 [Rhizopus delemar]
MRFPHGCAADLPPVRGGAERAPRAFPFAGPHGVHRCRRGTDEDRRPGPADQGVLPLARPGPAAGPQRRGLVPALPGPA